MKKYLFVIPSLSKGGAERVVSVLSSELTNQDREAVVVTHFFAENEYPVDPKVKVICLSGLKEKDYRDRMSPFYLLKLAKKLKKAILSEKPDYILPFLWTTCIRTDIALKTSSLKKKVIQTVRNNPNQFPRKKMMKKYRDKLVKCSRITIVQNEDQKKYFPEKFGDKIFVMPNPVSDSVFQIKRKLSDELFKIVAVGRLESQKNFPLLIRAVAELNKSRKNIRLDIFGEGSLREELQDLITKNGLDGIVTLRGRVNDYQTIYGDASAFVLSSDFEGMPNTLMEAMAVGLPCISTDCPTGPSDIIQNEVNGLLIPVNGNTELQEAVKKLMDQPQKAAEMGVRAKESIKQKYSKDVICRLLIKICEK